MYCDFSILQTYRNLPKSHTTTKGQAELGFPAKQADPKACINLSLNFYEQLDNTHVFRKC